MANASVQVERTGQHSFVAANDRGASVRIGRVGQEGSFTPVELLLAAAAGCAAVTAEELVVRRVGEDARFEATAEGVRQHGAHELDEVLVGLDVDLSALDPEQREHLVKAVRRAVEQLCTVTRTLKKSTPAPLAITS
ncbi:OsmC family peroxiredoxin [Solihabitans fulvus]|uniref:OsmC family peroxiredoxin n=1 Tax=Solihabitans fulvus TaxID=1892852 RepID=A0A5B2XCB4_9PSEU|nr:OsmC family protein [Solihabitans fulvus]KAA2261237.1 OsmC family peroxiredoxin [Solihabitans fulvus]